MYQAPEQKNLDISVSAVTHSQCSLGLLARDPLCLFPSAVAGLEDMSVYVEVLQINIDQGIYHKYAMNL